MGTLGANAIGRQGRHIEGLPEPRGVVAGHHGSLCADRVRHHEPCVRGEEGGCRDCRAGP
eukprot:9014-Eustigmatos_ZCMA.PRE.1